MFIHKAIESTLWIRDFHRVNSFNSGLSKEEIDQYAQDTVNNLMLCTSYHFESIEQIQEMTNKTGELFTGEYGSNIKLPYKSCWFDFECKGLDGISLAGVVAHELDDTSIWIETYTRGINKEYWIPNGITAFIGISAKLDKHLAIDRAKNLNGKEDVKVEMISDNIFFSDGMLKNSEGYADFDAQYEYDKREMLYLLKCFNSCLLLLSCKNIQTETVPAPTKLNKKRAKSGKPLISEHNVLRLVLPKRKNNSKKYQSTEEIQDKGGGWTQKPSFCSGHFKLYTEDAPLFGRLTGRYWWEPHVRGAESAPKKEYVVSLRRGK